MIFDESILLKRDEKAVFFNVLCLFRLEVDTRI